MQEKNAVLAAKWQRGGALVAAVTSHPDHKTPYLEWLNLKQAESTNWLDFLQEVNEDLYLILMRRFVNVQIAEPPELRCSSLGADTSLFTGQTGMQAGQGLEKEQKGSGVSRTPPVRMAQVLTPAGKSP